MNIKATMKAAVEVDASAEELFNGLASYFGLKSVFNTYRDIHWSLETSDDGDCSLVEYRDISYHGSPCYEKTGLVMSDASIIEAYKALKSIKSLIPKFNQ